MLMTIESFTYDFAGDTFIDVGGNIGMWATKIAPHYNNVLFIEPSDIAMNLAKKNIEEAGLGDKVTYFKNLCSDLVGEQKTITASGEDSGNFSIYNKEIKGFDIKDLDAINEELLALYEKTTPFSTVIKDLSAAKEHKRNFISGIQNDFIDNLIDIMQMPEMGFALLQANDKPVVIDGVIILLCQFIPSFEYAYM